jgi:hypothetical protein
MEIDGEAALDRGHDDLFVNPGAKRGHAPAEYWAIRLGSAPRTDTSASHVADT